MNPYGNEFLGARPNDDSTAGTLPSAPSYLPSDPHEDSYHPSLAATLQSPPLIHTGHSYLTALSISSPLYQASPISDGSQKSGSSPGTPTSPLPGTNHSLSLGSGLAVAPDHPVNPYVSTPPSCQVSVIIPSPDLCPSPLGSQCLEGSSPDLECAICFSEFNNVFRCPKMLQCKHTFCLECLARMNVKSAQPNTIQCPLCRSLTPLPALGLPKLTTDSDVLSYLPAAMQRVYSIRFQRNKGKLQVKRSVVVAACQDLVCCVCLLSSFFHVFNNFNNSVLLKQYSELSVM